MTAVIWGLLFELFYAARRVTLNKSPRGKPWGDLNDGIVDEREI